MNKKRKKRILIYILIGIVLYLVWSSFFSEHATMKHASPESGFKYYAGEGSEVMMVLEGDESAYVVGYEDKANTSMLFYKKDGYWRLASFPIASFKMRYLDNDGWVTFSKYKDKDCYVEVYPSRGEIVIEDSCGSEFVKLPNERYFYAVIKDYDENYWVSVNGQKISENSKVNLFKGWLNV